jgi:hypothetical protein
MLFFEEPVLFMGTLRERQKTRGSKGLGNMLKDGLRRIYYKEVGKEFTIVKNDLYKIIQAG